MATIHFACCVAPGTYKFLVLVRGCDGCPEGTYSDPGSAFCSPCTAGSYCTGGIRVGHWPRRCQCLQRWLEAAECVCISLFKVVRRACVHRHVSVNVSLCLCDSAAAWLCGCVSLILQQACPAGASAFNLKLSYHRLRPARVVTVPVPVVAVPLLSQVGMATIRICRRRRVSACAQRGTIARRALPTPQPTR